MTFIKPFLICFISNIFILIKAQEPISNAQRIFEFINYGPVGLLYGVLPSTISSLNITEQCSLSLNHTINELHNGSLWSNLMVASSGKGLRNLFEGSYLNLGNYDQCLSIRSSKLNLTATSDSSSNTTNFHGKYCLMSIVPQPSLLTSFGTNDSVKRSEFSDPTLNVSQKIDVLFRFRQQIHSKVAFCLPSTCTDQDVKVLINSVLDEYLWELLKPIDCQTKAASSFRQNLTSSRIETKISLFILFILLSCVLSSTLLHVFKYDGLDLIKCFSLKNNSSKFLYPKPKDNLVLNTLQSVVILFCVISHSYLYFIWLDAYVVYDKIYDYLFNAKNIFYQPFINIFEINTSLLFLVPSTFACIKLFSIENISFLQCLKEISSHLVRYLPIMIILVAIQLVLPLFVSGPLANEFFTRDAEFCSQSWYKNLLFINNFNEFDRQCVLNSWVISTEMQMFVLLTFLVLLYSKQPSIGKALNLVLISSSIISAVTITYRNSLSPQLLQMPFNLNKLKTYAKLIHFTPYVHLLEYFVPLFVLNLIFNKTVTRFHVTTRRVFLYLLIVAFVMIHFYSFPFNSLDYEGTPILNALVIIGCKSTLPAFFAWIIYNYYEFSLEELSKEIGLGLWYGKLFSDSNRLKQSNRLNGTALNGFKSGLKNDLEMVANVNGFKEENDKLMNDKNDLNDRLMNGDRIDRQLNYNLINDKLIIEMQDKLIQDKLLKIKLNELILNDHCLNHSMDAGHKNGKLPTNEHDPKSNRENSTNLSSFKTLLTIYTQLAKSIYYSHHYYLSYDLYSIRVPLSVDLYIVVARLIYNLVYIHLVAILFYLFIELPVYSFSKLIYKRILKSFNL